jgi:hypothetical protein
MWKEPMLLHLPLTLMLLACGQPDPVADNALAPPDNLVGDQAATGLAAPANAARAEAVQQAALPAATGGMIWSIAADRSAQFGPPGAPAFSIQCQKQREGPKQLIFIRYLAAPAGAKATMSFTGNGQLASAPVTGIANPAGPGGHWRAVVDAGDIARDIAEAFAGSGPVEVGISGKSPLVVPTSPTVRAVLAECLSG